MKRARSIWTADAEAVRISLWEQNLDDLRGNRKNSHVYMEMAAEMQAQGYGIDSSAIKIKLDNLTAKYRKTKTAMGTTGASAPSWHLYEQVHRIIGGLTINNLNLIVEESYAVERNIAPRPSSAANQSCSPPASSQLPPLSPSPSPSPFPSSPLPSSSQLPAPATPGPSSKAASAKNKNFERMAIVCEDMNKHFSEGMTHFKKSTEELVNLEKAKLLTMQELKDDAKRLTEGVLDFLNRH